MDHSGSDRGGGATGRGVAAMETQSNATQGLTHGVQETGKET